MATSSEELKAYYELLQKIKDLEAARAKAKDAEDAEEQARIQRELAGLRTIKKQMEDNGALLDALVQKEKDLAALYESTAAKFKGNSDIKSFAMQQHLKAINQEIDAVQKKARMLGEGDEAQVAAHQKRVVELQKQAELIKVNLEWQDKFTTSVEESVTSAKDLGKSLGGAFKGAFGGKDYAGTMVKMAKALRGGSVSALALGDAVASAAIGAFVNNIVGMAVALHDAESQFMKATGASEDFARAVTTTFDQTKEYGVTVKDASAATEALYKSYTDFTFLAEDTRVSLQNTVAVLSRYGIAVGDMAKGTQIATKMLGVSAQNAGRVQEEIADYAMAIGVAPAQMAASFAGAGANLAKFGDQGVRVFKDMQRTAKITGMEMDKLFQMTNKFDTFEGAATQAGKLNAALGGNFVNAMDLMMTTDPAERFDMIRSSILDAGLSFDTMSYYQKNFYKDALGLGDVSELALVLSGRQDLLAGSTNRNAASYEELAERAKTMQSLQEKWNAAIAENTPVLERMINGLSLVAKHFDTIIAVLQILVPMYVVFRSLSMIQNGLLMIGNGLLWLRAKLTGSQASAQLALNAANGSGVPPVVALDAANKSLGKSGAGATKNLVGLAPVLATIGVAALGVGVGIYAAATGIAALVLSFKDLGDMAPYAVNAIIGLTVIFGAFFALMAVVIYSGVGPLTAGVMFAIGGAALMMGAGVGLAAFGMSKLVESFAGLGAAAIPAAIGIGVFTFAFMKMMLALAAMVVGPLAPIATAAVSLLLSVGGAALMMGGGMALAGLGMKMFVSALQGVVDPLTQLSNIEFETFAGLAVALMALKFALLPFAAPWMLAAIAGFTLFGGALALIISLSTTAVAPLTHFFNSLPKLSANMTPLTSLVQVLKNIAAISLDDTAQDIRKIVGEIKKVDVERTKAFTGAMSAVTTSILEVRQAPTAALAAANASGANTRAGNTTVQIALDVGETRKFLEDVFNKGMGEYIFEAV